MTAPIDKRILYRPHLATSNIEHQMYQTRIPTAQDAKVGQGPHDNNRFHCVIMRLLLRWTISFDGLTKLLPKSTNTLAGCERGICPAKTIS